MHNLLLVGGNDHFVWNGLLNSTPPPSPLTLYRCRVLLLYTKLSYSMLRECAVRGKIGNGEKRRLQKDDTRNDGCLVQPS